MTQSDNPSVPAPATGSPASDSVRRFTIDAYAMTVGSITSAAAGLLTTILATRLLPSEDVGRAASGLIVSMMLLSFAAQLDLGNALHRFLPIAGQGARRLMVLSYGVTGGVSFGLACAFVLLYPGQLFEDRLSALLWFPIAVVSWTLFSMQDHVLICLGKAVYVPVKNALFGLARIPLLFAFVGIGAYGIFASMVVPTAVLFVILSIVVARSIYPVFLRRSVATNESADFRSVVRFAGASYPGALALATVTHTIPLLVLELLGDAAGGHFAIAWLISSNLDLVATNFGVSLVVQGASNPAQVPSLIRAALRRQVMVIGPAIAFFLLFAYPVLAVFGQEYADNATDLLRLLALSLIPRVLVSVYVPLLRIQRRIRLVLVIQLSMAVLILSLSFIGLRLGGLTGVGWGYLAAQSLIALAMAWPLWKAFRSFKAPASSPDEALMVSGPTTLS